jgi:hypothetical protein
MEFPTCYWTPGNGITKTTVLVSREDVKQLATSLKRDKHTFSRWQKTVHHPELYQSAFARRI